MRARLPDRDGFADCDGIKVGYEVFGEDHSPTVLLVHGWQMAPSLAWKMQVPYLARHFRVVTFDWPGNGRSDRPTDPASFTDEATNRWIPGVMEATGTPSATLVGHSGGTFLSVAAAAITPDRVEGLVLIGGGLPPDGTDMSSFAAPLEPDLWLAHFDVFSDFFWKAIIPEPHSTKARQDGAAWSSGATPESLAGWIRGYRFLDPSSWAERREEASRVRCPVIVINGTNDTVRMPSADESARLMNAAVVRLQGAGHCPHIRDAVRVNLEIRRFVERTARR